MFGCYVLLSLSTLGHLNRDQHHSKSDLIGPLLKNRRPVSQLSARTQAQSLRVMEPVSNEPGVNKKDAINGATEIIFCEGKAVN